MRADKYHLRRHVFISLRDFIYFRTLFVTFIMGVMRLSLTQFCVSVILLFPV